MTAIDSVQIPSTDEPQLPLPELSPAKAQWLLHIALERAAETLQHALPHCCRTLEEPPSLSSIEAIEARRFIVGGASRLSAAYAQALRKRQQASLECLLAPREAASIKVVSVAKLALISGDIPTADSIVAQVSASLLGALKEYTGAVQTIVGFLLQCDTLRKEDDPMQPALFVASLMDAAAQIDAPVPVRNQIVLLLGPLLAEPLRGVYTEFLDRMSARGITLRSSRRVVLARQARRQTVALSLQSMHSADRVAAEMVPLIFERIAQDSLVPGAIRALLLRLQMPFLKAAQMNADFFVAGSHLARQLIDRIASTAVGWTAQGEENLKFLALTTHIVETVCAEFDTNIAVFERLRGEFEHFIDTRAQRLGTPVARLLDALTQEEMRVARVIHIARQLQLALEGAELPDLLRDFLLGPWARVLAGAAADNAPANAQSPDPRARFQAVIHDLLWSVRPKASTDERQRLFVLIPALNRRLRDGLASIDFPVHEQRRLLRKIMQMHANAIRPVDQASYIKSSLDFTDLCTRLDQMQFASGDLEVGMIGRVALPHAVMQHAVRACEAPLIIVPMPVSLRPANAIEDEDLDGQIGSWQRGTWLRLAGSNRQRRAQLLWMSPRRSLFLFAADDASLLLLARPVLKAFLHLGLIDALEDAPLTQRAIAAVRA